MTTAKPYVNVVHIVLKSALTTSKPSREAKIEAINHLKRRKLAIAYPCPRKPGEPICIFCTQALPTDYSTETIVHSIKVATRKVDQNLKAEMLEALTYDQ